MLWTIAIILGLLWVLGVGSDHVFGGSIHILIAAAIILGTYRMIQVRWQRRAR